MLVGLLLLALTLGRAPSWQAAFGRAFAWAFAMEVITLRPVPAVVANFTPLGPVLAWACLPLLAALQSLAWGAAFALSHLAEKRFRTPRLLAFATGLFLALLAPAVFAWTPAGLLSPWPWLLQLADTVGEHGVSVLIGIAAALVAEALLKRTLVPVVLSAALLAAMSAHGLWRMRAIAVGEEKLSRIRVALLQPGIGAKQRWKAEEWPGIVLRLHELTLQAEDEGAELTVWPEAAYPYRLPHGAKRTPRGERSIVSRDMRGPVLAGLIMQGSGDSRYNSATVVMPNGTMQPPQDKLELLWFGETVPFGDTFPWLRRTFQPRGALVAGKDARLLYAGEARIAVLNCYEDSLTDKGRRMAALSPNLLVNVTNDAWFVPSAEPEIHLRLSVMRAIELRRDLVRSVNMGPSSWIDAAGNVRVRHETEEAGFVMANPSLRESPPTFYARFGHLPTATTLGSWFGLAMLARRRTGHEPAKA